MCGRFSQSMSREDYLSCLADEADRDIAYMVPGFPVQQNTGFPSRPLR